MSEKVDFTKVFDGIIERLQQKMTYLKTCEPYAGQLEGKIDELIVNAPAAFVIWGGAPFVKNDNLNYNEQDIFNILFVSDDIRGLTERLTDGETGVHRMILDGKNTLVNQKLGLEDIEPLQLRRTYPVFITKSYACYGIEVATNYDEQFAQE